MKSVLIIYPHWPPSNLVGVHRIRLVANHLASFGWHPIVLTVHERHYEETPVPELTNLVAPAVEVIKVEAHPVLTILGQRAIGDIGIRGWRQLKAAARNILRNRSIDFIWFSVPSWYPPWMGSQLKKEFHVPFGVDYQDPWVHQLPDSTPSLSRARLTQSVARWCEPRMLRNASLITAINDAYIEGIRERSPELNHIPRKTFQLGFDEQDHSAQSIAPELWPPERKAFLYAGAFLPLSAPFHRAVLTAAKELLDEERLPSTVHFVYVGTGHKDRPLTRMALELNIAEHVSEHPDRISFLEIQNLLNNTLANMVIGSPEPHYSASKVFQCILTGKPILGVLHEESEAAEILECCGAGATLAKFNGNMNTLVAVIKPALLNCFAPDGRPHFDLSPLQPFHAKRAAEALAQAMNDNLTP